MVAMRRHNLGKTAFVANYLDANPQATRAVVNAAWAEAGNPGTISGTLVQRIRSEKGLTGNIRPGRKSGAASGRKTRSRSKSNAGAKALANGPAAEGARPAGSGRAAALVEIEADLDRLIYKLIHVGGLDDVESALRRVRRLVIRSHKG